MSHLGQKKYFIVKLYLQVGLCSSLQQAHWYYEEGVSLILFPRCYNISNEEELSVFVENFRLTACISLLRLIHENKGSDNNIFIKEGTVGAILPIVVNVIPLGTH